MSGSVLNILNIIGNAEREKNEDWILSDAKEIFNAFEEHLHHSFQSCRILGPLLTVLGSQLEVSVCF
jgi:hypothetical protein